MDLHRSTQATLVTRQMLLEHLGPHEALVWTKDKREKDASGG
jgi:hypothetical protein